MIKQTVFITFVAFSVSVLANIPVPTDTPTQSSGMSVQEVLKTGPIQLKMHSLMMLQQGNLKGSIDESYLPGLIVCAKDKDVLIRSISARILGQNFVKEKDTPNTEVVELLISLSKDESNDVRFNAIYYGLTEVKYKSPELAKHLLDLAAKERSENLYDKIAVSLSTYQPQVTELLNEKLVEGDNIAIFEIYEDFTGQKPKDADKYLDMPSSRPRLFIISGDGEDLAALKAELIKDLKAGGVENPTVEGSGQDTSSVFMLTTYITRDYITAKTLLSNHDKFSITQEMWLTPELEMQIEAMRKAQ